MAYKTKVELSADKTYTLGGKDRNDPKSVEGYYLGSRVTPDKGYGPGTLHFFQSEEGNIGVWGKTRLNNLLTDELRGQMCRVTFTGMSVKTKGKNPAYLFKVEHDESNVIDVSGISLAQEAGVDQNDADNYGGDQDVDPDQDNEPPADEPPTPPAHRAAAPAQAPTAQQQAATLAKLNARRAARQ